MTPDSKITGQPLLLHGNKVNGVVQDALIIAANPYALNDTPSVTTVYFLDPATLGILARIDLSVPGYCTSPNNDENKPWDGCYGVHSTPVIDKAANILYFVDARRNNSNGSEFALLAYDINSMTQLASAVISGTCSSGQSFSGPYDQSQTTLLQRQRPALLLDHGHIYVAFGSGNDENAAYNGWVFAYNTYAGQQVLTLAGNPYCTSRSTVGFDAWGRGGIWQMGAGISADNEGNVYAATGNGRINNPSQDDGQSYVKIAGVPWTGTLQAKFQNPDPNNFLVANELEGSSGPIVLPGVGRVERILGASKMGLLTLMDASTMLPVQGPFRGAWNHYGPILGNPDASLTEQDAISCVSPTGCNASGLPSFNGQQNCCPQNCTCSSRMVKNLKRFENARFPVSLLAWYRKLIATKVRRIEVSQVLGSVPELMRKPSGWWCGWRRKIPGRAMTGSWAPWPTWVSGSRIRRWAIFSAAMIFHRLPSGSRRPAGRPAEIL